MRDWRWVMKKSQIDSRHTWAGFGRNTLPVVIDEAKMRCRREFYHLARAVG